MPYTIMLDAGHGGSKKRNFPLRYEHNGQDLPRMIRKEEKEASCPLKKKAKKTYAVERVFLSKITAENLLIHIIKSQIKKQEKGNHYEQ
jgi:cell fate regulator YaaT (PSP1 superfamily)